METEFPEYVVTDWTLLIDSREQAPFTFRNIKTDGKSPQPLLVRTECATLETGDYSIKGLANNVAVERKSLADFWSCCSGERERFVQQLERLSKLDFGVVVVEQDWSRILHGFDKSKLTPKTVYRSVIAWQQRLNVRWFFCPGRAFAEKTTYHILERFHRDVCDGKRTLS